MMRTLILLLMAISGCSHGKLMRCEGQVGAEYWHCPDQVEGAYFICSQPKDILHCEDVR